MEVDGGGHAIALNPCVPGGRLRALHDCPESELASATPLSEASFPAKKQSDAEGHEILLSPVIVGYEKICCHPEPPCIALSAWAS